MKKQKLMTAKHCLGGAPKGHTQSVGQTQLLG
jgi:hypothetical protein